MEYDNKVLKKYHESKIKKKEFIIERAKSEIEYHEANLKELKENKELDKKIEDQVKQILENKDENNI